MPASLLSSYNGWEGTEVFHIPLLSPHASSPLINTLTNVAHSYDESVNCMEINITHSSLLKESSPWVWTNIQECIHHDAIVQLFSFKSLYALAIDRFFFHSVHGVESASSGRFVLYKPLSLLPAFIYFLLGETQRTEVNAFWK